jgi:glyoxylate reductase
MTKPSVFVTRQIDTKALQELSQTCTVDIWMDLNPPSHAVLVEKASQVEGLLTLLTDPVDASLISAPGLRVISQMAVGTDNIDLLAATQRGLPVGHTPGVLTDTCADFTMALLLSVARRVVEADNEVHQGVWRPWGPEVLTGTELPGATLGLVGFGRIGQAVARRAAGFDMRIIYTDRKRNLDLENSTGAKFFPLEELLAQSDFVSLHVYYSPENHHMLDYSRFEMMKPGAYLINTSRGPVVNPAALVWALENKMLAGAALDVFEPEPIPVGHPLLSMPNVIITPHIASAGRSTRIQMAHIAVDNLLAGLSGERLPFCANPEVYNR